MPEGPMIGCVIEERDHQFRKLLDELHYRQNAIYLSLLLAVIFLSPVRLFAIVVMTVGGASLITGFTPTHCHRLTQ